jgi:hypothetical protein
VAGVLSQKTIPELCSIKFACICCAEASGILAHTCSELFDNRTPLLSIPDFVRYGLPDKAVADTHLQVWQPYLSRYVSSMTHLKYAGMVASLSFRSVADCFMISNKLLWELGRHLSCNKDEQRLCIFLQNYHREEKDQVIVWKK